MSCILKFWSLKISLETLQRSFHRGEKKEIYREASPDISNSSPFRIRKSFSELLRLGSRYAVIVRPNGAAKLVRTAVRNNENYLREYPRKPTDVR